MIRPGKLKGIATPIPLGLATLGTSTFLMGFAILFQAHASWPPYFAQVLMFGGLVQLLAGMWSFAYGDALAATTFSFVGAFYGWLGFEGLGSIILRNPVAPAVYDYSNAMILVVCGFVVLYLWIAAFNESMAFNATLCCLWLAMELIAIDLFTGAVAFGIAGGALAILCGLFAAYASFADVYNATGLQEVMPTGEPEAIRERSVVVEQERILQLHPREMRPHADARV
jgi:uncharacterized protein